MTTESQERRDLRLRGLDEIQLELVDARHVRDGSLQERRVTDLDKSITQSSSRVKAALVLKYFAYPAPEHLASDFAFMGALL
jgi:hypothetical protein